MRIKELPFTVEQVRELWDYCPVSGILTYRPRPQQQGVRKDLFGKVVGQKTKDGLVVYSGINGKRQSFLAHRIVWLHYYGEHAQENIEHIDGDKHNNSVGNLRLEDTSYKNRDITYEDFAAAFEYNAETGEVFRTGRSSKYSEFTETDATGTYESSGYLCINFLGRGYRLHRVAWMLYYKKWPNFNIDHINGDRKDNRLCNLRDATHRINAQNLRTAPKRSTTGLLGVTLKKHNGKYAAQITIDGKKTHLGYFDRAEEAHQAYLEAKRKYHPGCTI